MSKARVVPSRCPSPEVFYTEGNVEALRRCWMSGDGLVSPTGVDGLWRPVEGWVAAPPKGMRHLLGPTRALQS